MNLLKCACCITYCLMLLLQSCNKDNTTYTLSGRLYEDCSLKPLANQQIYLYQRFVVYGFGNSSGGGTIANTTTDANGYFKFNYQNQTSYGLSISTERNSPEPGIIQNIPYSRNIDTLSGIAKPTTNVQVWLNATNPYTINDTLYIYRLDSILLAFHGPFNNGKLYTTKSMPVQNANQDSMFIEYKINDTITNPNNYYYVRFKGINCDTSKVTINLK